MNSVGKGVYSALAPQAGPPRTPLQDAGKEKKNLPNTPAKTPTALNGGS